MATFDKAEKGHLEQSDSDLSIDNNAAINAFTPEEQRKIMWRIDVRLVLTL